MGTKRSKRNKRRSHAGLQSVTLTISTAMVLILLGLVVLAGLVGYNLQSQVKENLRVTMMLGQDMTTPEARQLCKKLQERPYIKRMEYVSKEQALKEATREMGTDVADFVDGNPFTASIDLTIVADYANNDSLRWIVKELKTLPKVGEISYQRDLVEAVNRNLAKISLVLLVLAVLLTFVSFSLINNTVRLSIYARRFSIHTMKLVGASWGFIRWPFVRKSLVLGVLAALLALLVLAALVYGLYRYEPGIESWLTWREMAITGVSVLLFGVLITGICSGISVNRFLRMKAGELYKI